MGPEDLDEQFSLNHALLERLRVLYKSGNPSWACDFKAFVQVILNVFERGSTDELRTMRRLLGGEVSGDPPDVERVRGSEGAGSTGRHDIWTEGNPKNLQPK